jgi:succinoglycan biosynthesis transport protein ExoP
MIAQNIDQTQRLSDYFEIVAKHKWNIILTFLVVFGLVAVYTFNITPIYESSASLVLAYEQVKSPVTGETIVYENYMSQALNFNTHFSLIKSRPVIEKVIRKLDLTQLNSDVFVETSPWKQIFYRFKENIRILLGRKKELVSPQRRESNLIEMLRKKTRAQRVPNTYLVKVIVEDHDPEMATDIANALAESYIEFNISYRMQSSKNTLNWMTNQLYEIQKQLEDSEEEFLNFKGKERLFSLEGKKGIIEGNLSTFNSQLLDIRNKRRSLEARLAEMERIFSKAGNVTQIQSWVDNELVKSLYNQLVKSEVELSRLSKVYKSKHPKVLETQAAISKIQRKLKDEITKEIENMKAQRSVMYASEKVLQETLDGFESDALNTNKRELKYRILARNVETNRKLYDILLSKVKESNMVDNINASDSSTNIRIAENAIVPQIPVKPDKKRNLISGVIMGLLTGLGITFLLEYKDRSLHTEDDVRKHMGLPVLAIIPVAEKSKRKVYGASSNSKK